MAEPSGVPTPGAASPPGTAYTPPGVSMPASGIGTPSHTGPGTTRGFAGVTAALRGLPAALMAFKKALEGATAAASSSGGGGGRDGYVGPYSGRPGPPGGRRPYTPGGETGTPVGADAPTGLLSRLRQHPAFVGGAAVSGMLYQGMNTGYSQRLERTASDYWTMNQLAALTGMRGGPHAAAAAFGRGGAFAANINGAYNQADAIGMLTTTSRATGLSPGSAGLTGGVQFMQQRVFGGSSSENAARFASLYEPGVVNRMYAYYGMAAIKPGGDPRTSAADMQQLAQQIIFRGGAANRQNLNLSQARAAFRPGSPAYQQLVNAMGGNRQMADDMFTVAVTSRYGNDVSNDSLPNALRRLGNDTTANQMDDFDSSGHFAKSVDIQRSIANRADDMADSLDVIAQYTQPLGGIFNALKTFFGGVTASEILNSVAGRGGGGGGGAARGILETAAGARLAMGLGATAGGASLGSAGAVAAAGLAAGFAGRWARQQVLPKGANNFVDEAAITLTNPSAIGVNLAKKAWGFITGDPGRAPRGSGKYHVGDASSGGTTSDDQLLMSRFVGSRTQWPANITNLHPQLKKAAANLLRKNPNLQIASAYRPIEHQQRLWDEAVAKYGSEEAARKWVAPPGRSAHQWGMAIDFGPSSEYGWLKQHAPGEGLWNYDVEPWHWEPDNGAGGRLYDPDNPPASPGGGGGAPASTTPPGGSQGASYSAASSGAAGGGGAVGLGGIGGGAGDSVIATLGGEFGAVLGAGNNAYTGSNLGDGPSGSRRVGTGGGVNATFNINVADGSRASAERIARYVLDRLREATYDDALARG